MRRGLASLIMGLALLVATASWAGFVMSRTVLDPGRSEALADTLLDDPEIRSTIVDRLADSAESQIPTDVPVTRDVVETAAETALDDPAVEALIRDGLVQAHQNALNGIDEPVMLDGSALGAAGREAVVAQQPELDQVLPPTPALEVELPSTGLSWLGTVKRYVDRFTLFGAIVAIAGVSAAFILARNRAAALRRVAFWAVSASAFWIIAAYALPWVLERIAPSSVSIASAAIDVFFGAMIRPAVTLAAVGVGLLLLSFVWPVVERRRPAARLDRGTAAAARQDPGRWTPVASAASVAAQPSIDLRHQAAHHGHGQQPHAAQPGHPTPAWSPVATPPAARQVPSQPAPYQERPGYADPGIPAVDPTRPFPQIWSNVEREAAPNPNAAPTLRPNANPAGPPPAPPTEVARPGVGAPDGSDGAATRIAAPARADVPPVAPATQIAGAAPAAVPGAGGPPAPPTQAAPSIPANSIRDQANATQIAGPGDLAPPQPRGPAQQPGQGSPSAFELDIDADAAADADDFGAEWIEGAGYVDGDSAR